MSAFDAAVEGEDFVGEGTQQSVHRPPAFHWRRNGDKKGFFYLKADVLRQTKLIDVGGPWVMSERYDAKQGELVMDGFPADFEPAFECTELKIMPIALRVRPFYEVEDPQTRQKKRVYVPEYVAGHTPRMKLDNEILCAAEGIPEPLILKLDGFGGQSFTKVKADDRFPHLGIFPAYRGGLLAAGIKRAQEKRRDNGGDPSTVTLQPYTFWLPIGTRVDAKGRPVAIRTTEGAKVTILGLAWPDDKQFTSEDVDEWYVGADWYKWAAAVKEEYAEWLIEGRGDQLFRPRGA